MSELGALRRAVDEVAAEAEQRMSGADCEQVRGVRDYLMQPLTVAVVGRVSSGKSTLVNALVGSPVAATDATDCTQVVTWLRHGRHPAATMVLDDGSEQALLISATGTLPATLPVEVERVSRIELRDAADTLRRMTLVDTPGLASARTRHSERTIEFMASTSGQEAQRADALVFVFNGSLLADEAAAVDLFLSGERSADVAGTIGVLTKADTVGADDPIRAADAVARSLASEHARLFSDVVAVSGLLAETVRCGRLTETHARALAELAAQWPEATADLACADADLFCSLEATVDAPTRHDLLRRIGLYGARTCIAEAREGRPRAHQMNALLSRVSGFARLESVLDHDLGRRVDALKARRAVGLLSDISYGLRSGQQRVGSPEEEQVRTWLRRRLQEALDSPQMHPLTLLDAAHQVDTGRVLLPRGLEDELHRIVAELPGSPPAQDAVAGIQRWRGFALLASPPQRRVADAVTRAWELTVLAGDR